MNKNKRNAFIGLGSVVSVITPVVAVVSCGSSSGDYDINKAKQTPLDKIKGIKNLPHSEQDSLNIKINKAQNKSELDVVAKKVTEIENMYSLPSSKEEASLALLGYSGNVATWHRKFSVHLVLKGFDKTVANSVDTKQSSELVIYRNEDKWYVSKDVDFAVSLFKQTGVWILPKVPDKSNTDKTRFSANDGHKEISAEQAKVIFKELANAVKNGKLEVSHGDIIVGNLINIDKETLDGEGRDTTHHLEGSSTSKIYL